MTIGTLKRALLLARAANVTPFVWGHRGIGKSQINQQVAWERQWGFIDLRCSQLEASDIRGLPDKQDGRTVFMPPADMPIGGMSWADLEKELGFPPSEIKKRVDELKDDGKEREASRLEQLYVKSQPKLDKGILFLDEINRAQDDVLQAVFQLVLDRRVGMYTIPAGWSIVAAGNYMEGYMTNGFTDPAFLNRFCHLILSADELTLPEWVEYMGELHAEEATSVIEYASQNIKHLHGDVKGELGFSVQPSPRSWDAVVRVNKATRKAEFGGDAKMAVLSGLVGMEAATAYSTYNCPVKPMDIIQKGVDGVRSDLSRLDRNQISGLTWGLGPILKKRIEDDNYAKIAMDFVRWLAKDGKDCKDIAIAFCGLMVSGGTGPQKVKTAMISNPNVAKLVGKYTEGGKSFIHRLNNDPELHRLISNVAWGKLG